jgi:hypothetical protein
VRRNRGFGKPRDERTRDEHTRRFSARARTRFRISAWQCRMATGFLSSSRTDRRVCGRARADSRPPARTRDRVPRARPRVKPLMRLVPSTPPMPGISRSISTRSQPGGSPASTESDRLVNAAEAEQWLPASTKSLAMAEQDLDGGAIAGVAFDSNDARRSCGRAGHVRAMQAVRPVRGLA